jgi:transcriptional regulator
MYTMPYYTSENREEIFAFMQTHPFIPLIGYDGQYPVATQVPVKIINEGNALKLIGHVMTKTDHCKAFEMHPNVMAVFSGAHSYISASVYEKPAAASTWNYKTVQAKGIIRLLSQEQTYEIIKDITDKYEDPHSSPSAFHKMDKEYIRKNLKAITGFEIVVSHISHVFKMSQDHAQNDRERILEDLLRKEDASSLQMAEEMKRYV